VPRQTQEKPLAAQKYVVEFGCGTRPVIEPDGETYFWICPVFLRRKDQKHGQFIADIHAFTPIDAAARAAALGQMLLRALERQVNTDGTLRGDAYGFARVFEVPDGRDKHRTAKPQDEGHAQ
jgi:hypothetical protein